MYKKANTYTSLVDDVVSGNPEGIPVDELRSKAWTQINHLFTSNKEENKNRYMQLAGMNDGRAAKDIKEIVKAALHGRIDILFIDKNAGAWGKIDPENAKIQMDKEHG